MFDVRDGLFYTDFNEWVAVEEKNVRFGLSDIAQNEFKEVTSLELPAVGTHVYAGDKIGAVKESRNVDPLFSPISGTVVEVNPKIEKKPFIVKESPYDDGWLIVVKMDDPSELDRLQNSSEYKANL